MRIQPFKKLVITCDCTDGEERSHVIIDGVDHGNKCTGIYFSHNAERKNGEKVRLSIDTTVDFFPASKTEIEKEQTKEEKTEPTEKRFVELALLGHLYNDPEISKELNYLSLEERQKVIEEITKKLT